MGIRVVQLWATVPDINRACGLVDVTFGTVIMLQSGDRSIGEDDDKARWWLLTYREHQRIDWEKEGFK